MYVSVRMMILSSGLNSTEKNDNLCLKPGDQELVLVLDEPLRPLLLPPLPPVPHPLDHLLDRGLVSLVDGDGSPLFVVWLVRPVGLGVELPAALRPPERPQVALADGEEEADQAEQVEGD